MPSTPTLSKPPVPPAAPRFAAPPTPPDANESVVALGQMMTVLGQDPRYRGKILDIIAEAAPTLHIPERAVTEQIDATAKTLREQNAHLTERLTRVEGDLSRQKWQEANGVDDEEYAAVVTLAKEKKIGDPDTALDYFRRAELGRPRSSSGATAMTEESRKLLYKNPKAWAEQEAHKILNESRRRRGA